MPRSPTGSARLQGCVVFGRRTKGLWGRWQFLCIDLGGGCVGIYLEITIVLYVFVLYTPLFLYVLLYN